MQLIMDEFDRIQADIANAQGELLDAISVFNDLATQLIRSNEWKDHIRDSTKRLRSDLQEIEYKLTKANF